MFRPLALFNRKRRDLVFPESYSADPFYRFQHEMNRLFDEVYSSLPFAGDGSFPGDARIKMDMRETDSALIVEADLPGVADDDIDVQLTDNMLTIRGEKRHERKEDRGEDYHFIERSYGAFSRSIPLPYDVDPDSVDAVFKDGVLTLTMPKPEGAKERRRRIAVKKG